MSLEKISNLPHIFTHQEVEELRLESKFLWLQRLWPLLQPCFLPSLSHSIFLGFLKVLNKASSFHIDFETIWATSPRKQDDGNQEISCGKYGCVSMVKQVPLTVTSEAQRFSNSEKEIATMGSSQEECLPHWTHSRVEGYSNCLLRKQTDLTSEVRERW